MSRSVGEAYNDLAGMPRSDCFRESERARGPGEPDRGRNLDHLNRARSAVRDLRRPTAEEGGVEREIGNRIAVHPGWDVAWATKQRHIGKKRLFGCGGAGAERGLHPLSDGRAMGRRGDIDRPHIALLCRVATTGRGMICECQANLPGMILTHDFPAGLACSGHRGKKHRCEQRDDRDRDEEFEKRQPAARVSCTGGGWHGEFLRGAGVG